MKQGAHLLLLLSGLPGDRVCALVIMLVYAILQWYLTKPYGMRLFQAFLFAAMH